MSWLIRVPTLTPGAPARRMTQTTEQLNAFLADRYHLDHEAGRGSMPAKSPTHDLRHNGGVALEVLHLVPAR